VDQDLLVQNRALGDPTRHAVFAYLRDAPGPVGVAELTGHLGLNHNAIRQHLAKLRAAGLVIEERGPSSGPGRPPLCYRPVPGAAERWGGASPYEELALMLLDLVRGGSPLSVGREAGRRLAEEYGAGSEADAVEILEAVARRLGFEPHAQVTGAGVDVVLNRCPFLASAAEAPDIICQLHRGIAEGIAERATGDAVIEGLVVRPPDRAGCRIRVTLPAPTDGSV
jgi:predicted ArsR family transcriptional regulator